jgi:hypothetical protein
MYLTYQKSLPSFDQHMVQLEFDAPDASKVYVEFQEGFLPLAAKYYEALSAAHVAEEVIEPPMVEPTAEEVIEAMATVDAPMLIDESESNVDETVEVPVTKKSRKQSV